MCDETAKSLGASPFRGSARNANYAEPDAACDVAPDRSPKGVLKRHAADCRQEAAMTTSRVQQMLRHAAEQNERASEFDEAAARL